MFSDFDAKARREKDGGRRTVSLLLAAAIFVGLAILIGAAIATAHAVVEQPERDVDVQFAAMEHSQPEPEPPPPPPPPPPPERRPPRAHPPAVVDAPPTSIPDERPQEAEGALADSGEVGPSGSEDGVEGGTGPVHPAPPPPPPPPPPGPPRPPPPPPSQERIEVSPPRILSGCQRPERPEGLEGATAETITIYVRVIVGPDGRVLRARIEESHPLIPDRSVLGCIETRIYEAAHLPDGTPVPYPLRYAFTFRPDVP